MKTTIQIKVKKQWEAAKDRNPIKPDDIIVVKRCVSETEYDWMREAWGNRNNAIEEIRKMIEG